MAVVAAASTLRTICVSIWPRLSEACATANVVTDKRAIASNFDTKILLRTAINSLPSAIEHGSELRVIIALRAGVANGRQ